MYTIENESGIKTFMHPVKSAGISIHSAIIDASNTYNNYKVHVNQRHAHIRNLPEVYKSSPIFVTVREPHSWYKSFYRFFLKVDGYLSWALNDPKDDGYIYPISPDEFVRRMINMKDTLIKYPNKSRVFRNLLRSQGNMHFITGYFEKDFHPDDIHSMQQFNMSLYDWFMKPMGEESIFVPIKRLDIIEKEFNIKIPHLNKTDAKNLNFNFKQETIELIKETHREWYQMIEDFDENNYTTISEWRAK
jgi:hypothetical protein